MDEFQLPESHPLSRAWRRHQRAVEHVEEIEALERAIQQHYSQGVPAYLDPDTGRYVPALPPLEAERKISVIAGEVLYNLRAAIDYLVFILAKHDSGRIQSGTQFPIEDTPEGFAGRRKTYLKGVSDVHVAEIELFQPYKGSLFMTLLRDLSNPDKHRDLHAIVSLLDPYPASHQVAFATHIAETNGRVVSNGVQVNLRGSAEIFFESGPQVTMTLYEIQADVAYLFSVFNSELKSGG